MPKELPSEVSPQEFVPDPLAMVQSYLDQGLPIFVTPSLLLQDDPPKREGRPSEFEDDEGLSDPGEPDIKDQVVPFHYVIEVPPPPGSVVPIFRLETQDGELAGKVARARDKALRDKEGKPFEERRPPRPYVPPPLQYDPIDLPWELD